MRQLAQSIVNFLKREDGPTAVEYAVMLALIIVVCITAITALGTNANKTFTTVSGVIRAEERRVGRERRGLSPAGLRAVTGLTSGLAPNETSAKFRPRNCFRTPRRERAP